MAMDIEMIHISTEIDINAPIQHVWEIIADFSSYSDWNPFIRSINGEQQPGSTLNISVQPTWRGQAISSKTKSSKTTLVVFSPGRELRWQKRLLVRGLLDGQHYFQLSDKGTGVVRLLHGAQFSGLLAPLIFGKLMQGQTKEVFGSMDKALKQRAETA